MGSRWVGDPDGLQDSVQGSAKRSDRKIRLPFLVWKGSRGWGLKSGGGFDSPQRNLLRGGLGAGFSHGSLRHRRCFHVAQDEERQHGRNQVERDGDLEYALPADLRQRKSSAKRR